MSKVILYTHAPSQPSIEYLQKYSDWDVAVRKTHFEVRPNHKLIFNWGYSLYPNWYVTYPRALPFINYPERVCNSIDKRETFCLMEKAGVRTVPFTLDRDVAQSWLLQNYIIAARTKVKGLDGVGIELCDSKNYGVIPPAKLYTVYIPADVEYRVYVFQGKVVSILRKCQNIGGAKDVLVRTGQNGWHFEKGGFSISLDSETQCVKAAKAVGLDFVGIDLLISHEDSLGYVLETNTAPDIRGHVSRILTKLVNEYVTNL